MNKNEPRIAVIILNYNGWSDTIECLESLLKSNYTNFQIIVCDNASTNSSLEKLIEWANERPCPFLRLSRNEAESGVKVSENILIHGSLEMCPIIMIDTGGNLGFAGGNNVGIRYVLSQGNFYAVWLLNNDTVIQPTTLKEMVLLSLKNSNTGIIGSKVLFYFEPNSIQSYGNMQMGWKGVGNSLYAGRHNSELPDLEVRSVIGASLLITLSAIEKTDLMDESYFMQDEETDWCARVKAKGYKIYSCGTSIVYHKEGKSSDRIYNERKFFGWKSRRKNIKSFLITGYYSTRNEIYFVKKNFPQQYIFYIILILPLKVIKLLLGIILFGDDHKSIRINLILKAVRDGLMSKMGMTINPEHWKSRFTNL